MVTVTTLETDRFQLMLLVLVRMPIWERLIRPILFLVAKIKGYGVLWWMPFDKLILEHPSVTGNESAS